MEEVFSDIEVLENSKIFELSRSYFKDAKYFYEKGDFINAFEAVIISWAYIDALLHLGKVKVSEKVKKYFTIDKE